MLSVAHSLAHIHTCAALIHVASICSGVAWISRSMYVYPGVPCTLPGYVTLRYHFPKIIQFLFIRNRSCLCDVYVVSWVITCVRPCMYNITARFVYVLWDPLVTVQKVRLSRLPCLFGAWMTLASRFSTLQFISGDTYGPGACDICMFLLWLTPLLTVMHAAH